MKRSARWPVALVCLVLGVGAGTYITGSLLRGQNPAAPVYPKEMTSYREVVKKVLPAVVSIEARSKPTAQPKQPKRSGPRDLDPRIPEEFRRFFEEFDGFQFDGPNPSPRLGFGSGFIVDPNGVIMTNHHVVAGADSVDVHLHDGRKFTSTEIFTDPKTDLAIVKINVQDKLPHLEFGDSDDMEIGDRVLAVGAPFGLTGSVTHGIVSGKRRNGLNMNMYEDFLQTDAPINPGNSGGPLVNLEGKVIGINSAIKSRSGGFQGVGLAIASNLAVNVKNHLLQHGTVKRGYLGIQIKDIDPAIAPRLGVEAGKGVVVAQVFADTPAGKAGIQAGDVITAVAGRAVENGRELQRIVADLPLGQATAVAIVRDGKAQTVQVTIEEQPHQYGTASVPLPQAPKRDRTTVRLDQLGLEIGDLTPDTAEPLGYKSTDKGVVVTQVEAGGLAEAAGLRRGTLILKVDQIDVATTAEAKAALDNAALDKGILLQVRTPQGGVDYLLLKNSSTARQ
ncbi:MAG: Do family serine endopeptidase [Gemmataceae bacterium]